MGTASTPTAASQVGLRERRYVSFSILTLASQVVTHTSMLEEISERPSSANQSENHRFEQNGGKRPGQKLWDKALSQPTILVFFTKVLPEKQNRNKNKMLWLFAVPNSLAFIKACCRGESLIGRHFSVSFLRLWGQCHTLILSFLGL